VIRNLSDGFDDNAPIFMDHRDVQLNLLLFGVSVLEIILIDQFMHLRMHVICIIGHLA